MTDRDRDLRLAVVIPTLNEESSLGATLASLRAQGDDVARIVVADGGSRDGTVALADEHGACVVVVPRQGRGCQIAAAVGHLDEEIIVVIHADMTLPPGALASVRERLVSDPACPGGCLGHRFDSPRLIYRLIELWDRWRARLGHSYGDQAQFFRRDLIAREGGFPELSIMEDVELSRRLRRLGRPVYLDRPAVVSPRRFERLGWWGTVRRNLRIRILYGLSGTRACRALYENYYGNAGGRGETVADSPMPEEQPVTDSSVAKVINSVTGWGPWRAG